MKPRDDGMLSSCRPSCAYHPPVAYTPVHLALPTPNVNNDHDCGFPLQFAEMLSGRYADVLSGLFLGYATLWYTSHHKNIKGLDKVTDFAMQVSAPAACAYVPPGLHLGQV